MVVSLFGLRVQLGLVVADYVVECGCWALVIPFARSSDQLYFELVVEQHLTEHRSQSPRYVDDLCRTLTKED